MFKDVNMSSDLSTNILNPKLNPNTKHFNVSEAEIKPAM